MSKNKRLKAKNESGPFFTLVEHPFSKIPHDKLIKGLVEVGHSSTNKFKITLKTIQNKIRSLNPLQLLSVMSAYGLFVGVSEDGKIKENKKLKFLQSHLELTQALVLSNPQSQLSELPAAPQKVQELFELSISLADSFSMRRITQLENANTETERAILYFQERLRNHTQIVRNWGYFKNVIAFSKRLYSPIDDLFKKKMGIKASELIDIFEYLVATSEKEINKHWNKFRPIFETKSIEQAVYKYYEKFPELKGSPEELITFFKKENASLESVFSFALSHYDLRLPDIFTFSANSLAQKKGINAIDLRRSLSMLSLSFGELENVDTEHFFLGNPVWTKPLIKVEDDTFFCAFPQIFFSFIFKTLSSLMEDDVDAQKLIASRRAKFLEDEIFRLMQNHFKNSRYIRNFRWNDLSETYETDLIYKVDSYLLIIEAKSGAISWPALRGAPHRIERHIRELFISPSQQSQRLASKLLKLKMGEKDIDGLLSQLPFNLKSIQKIIRLSVTLDDFGMIQSNVASLKSTGWIEDNFIIAPTILLSDLEIIFDILMSTPEKIHYLLRRTELEEHLEYAGDEVDLIGLYLDTGFNLGEIEFSKNRMQLIGMSKKIDQYYIALDQNIKTKKPSMKSTRWWTSILNHIEKRHPDRWSEISVMLLNVSFDDQCRAKKKLNKIVKNVKRNWQKKNHLNSIILYPHKWREEAVAFLAFRERNKEERYNLLEDLASQIFENNQIKRCLIMGINIDNDLFPYYTLMVFDRPCQSALKNDPLLASQTHPD